MEGAVLTDEELVAEVRRLYDELGRTPRINDIREHGQYSYQAYNRRWDGIREVLDAAGIPHHDRINAGRKVDEADLLEEVRHLSEELGRTPTTLDVSRHGRFAHATYYNHFDSFSEVLERAGFEETETNRISDEDLLHEVRELTDDLGRTPTSSEMNEKGEYHAGTYYNRFGSWTAAVEKATST